MRKQHMSEEGEEIIIRDCSVCLEEIQGQNVHELSCGHALHATCYIQCLKRGRSSCPLCRSAEQPAPLGHMTLLARATYLRRTVGRRKSCPSSLTLLIDNVKKMEKRSKEAISTAKQHRTEHRGIFSKDSKLRRARWAADRKAREALRLLGSYDCDDLRLPTLVVSEGFL